MSNGWSDLVRIPFFSFLPNFFLGVGLLYVLKWTGVIWCWDQLFSPIYDMGPEWAIPSWLSAFFILAVVFGLGWGVSSIGNFFTLLPFQIENSTEEYLKHVYFYDYSNSRPSYAGYPTTIRYTPFRKEAIHQGILWHVFKREHFVSEFSEKSFSLTSTINSGLFMLAFMYAVLEFFNVVRGSKLFMTLWFVLIIVLMIGACYYCLRKCLKCRELKSELESSQTFPENSKHSNNNSDVEIAGLKVLLFYLLVCPVVGWLVAILGSVWLIVRIMEFSTLEPAFRVSFAFVLAIMFYVDAIRDRIHANALNYTHYWKVKEETRKK